MVNSRRAIFDDREYAALVQVNELHWILFTNSQTFTSIIVRGRCEQRKTAADKSKKMHILPMSTEREFQEDVRQSSVAADLVVDDFRASYIACSMLQNETPLQVMSTCYSIMHMGTLGMTAQSAYVSTKAILIGHILLRFAPML